MTTITFDTLAYAKRFKSAGFSDQQAEKVVAALQDVRDARIEEMVTKSDIKEVVMEIEKVRREISESKAKTIKWIVGLLLAQTGLIITVFRTVPIALI
ncbi:MAG: CCDC90 family protein [Magnetococcus sp. THC-1_WYH]